MQAGRGKAPTSHSVPTTAMATICKLPSPPCSRTNLRNLGPVGPGGRCGETRKAHLGLTYICAEKPLSAVVLARSWLWNGMCSHRPLEPSVVS